MRQLCLIELFTQHMFQLHFGNLVVEVSDFLTLTMHRCLIVCTTVDPSVECRLVVQALRLNTLSKLTFADSKRFDALVKDVFLGVPFKDVEYMDLENALREACQESNLVVIESQVHMMCVRVYLCLPTYHVCLYIGRDERIVCVHCMCVSVHRGVHMFVCKRVTYLPSTCTCMVILMER